MRVAGVYYHNNYNFKTQNQHNQTAAYQPAFGSEGEKTSDSKQLHKAALALAATAMLLSGCSGPSNSASKPSVEQVHVQEKVASLAERVENLGKEVIAVTEEVEKFEENNGIYSPPEFKDYPLMTVDSKDFEKIFRVKLYRYFEDAEKNLKGEVKEFDKGEIKTITVHKGEFKDEHVYNKKNELISYRRSLENGDPAAVLAIELRENFTADLVVHNNRAENVSIRWIYESKNGKDGLFVSEKEKI